MTVQLRNLIAQGREDVVRFEHLVKSLEQGSWLPLTTTDLLSCSESTNWGISIGNQHNGQKDNVLQEGVNNKMCKMKKDDGNRPKGFRAQTTDPTAKIQTSNDLGIAHQLRGGKDNVDDECTLLGDDGDDLRADMFM